MNISAPGLDHPSTTGPKIARTLTDCRGDRDAPSRAMAVVCQDAAASLTAPSLIHVARLAPSSPSSCRCVRLGLLSAEQQRAAPDGRRRGRMRRRSLAVSGVLRHAVKGAVQEVRDARGLYHRLRVAIAMAVIFFHESKGLVLAIPAALYALHLHASLPGVQLGKASLVDAAVGKPSASLPAAVARKSKAWVLHLARRIFWSRVKAYSASVVRDLRFGDAERNVLDLYVPRAHTPGDSVPVVVFVHGGIWAMGEKWQFSALGACLADNGVLAVLVQYSLYPEVLACEQVKEVSRALSWTFDNILDYGGDPSRVYLMGHSAGAHLSAMVLWERASLLAKSPQPDVESAQLVANGFKPAAAAADARQPHCFIGLAGVYDIVEHYLYENRRGVAALSCMMPAMGGPEGFASMSPTLLFRSLRQLQHQAALLGNGDAGSEKAPVLPPFYLYASQCDTVVPAHSSMAFCEALVGLGCTARVFLHDSLSHDDFAFWDKGRVGDTRCGPLVKDLLAILGSRDAGDALPLDGVAGAQELQPAGS